MEDVLVKDGRQETVLRMAIWHAERHGYDGPGKDWCYQPAAKLREVIERGDHVPVLRSEPFAQRFWHLRLVATTYIGTTPPVNLHCTEITSDEVNRWREHHAAIQAVDPLEYLSPFIH